MSVPPPGHFQPPTPGAVYSGFLEPRIPIVATDRVAIWLRIGAYLVDAGIAGLAAAGCARVLGIDVGGSLLSVPYLALFLFWWTAVHVQGARVAGESLGKRLAGVQVVTRDGAPLGTSQRLLREGPLMVPYLVPVVAIVDALIAEGGERRSVRDRVAGTAVVHVSGARPQRARMALIVIGAAIATGFLLQPLVAEHASVDRAHRETVAECTSGGGLSIVTCECIFRRLEQQLPKAALVQAAADRRDNMPYEPNVLTVINAAAAVCKPLSLSGGNGTPA